MKIAFLIITSLLLTNNVVSQCQKIVLNPQCVSHSLEGNAINVCPNDTVFFSAHCEFPENDIYYHQSDSTCQFIWYFFDFAYYCMCTPCMSFGEMYVDSIIGKDVSHSFSMNQIVGLKVIDIQSCETIDSTVFHIRVPNNQWAIANASPINIDPGDTVWLSGGYTEISNHEYSGGGQNSIPYACGATFNTYKNIFFSDTSGVISSVNDIESICVNMYHEYMSDLAFYISCPNGQHANLQYYTGGSTVLGEPNFESYMSSGYDYCWKNDSLLPTMTEVAALCDTLLAGFYFDNNAFESLVGCPFNGEWRMTIEDAWSLDNGYVYDWDINFKNGFETNYCLSHSLDSFVWIGINIDDPYSLNTFAIPNETGYYDYSLICYYNSGCSFIGNRQITVGNPMSINNNGHQKTRVFPNPATSYIEIKSSRKYDRLQILDYLERIVIEETGKNISIDKLETGKYYINLIRRGEIIETISFIKL